MIVIADSSPLNYLVLIGEADLLYQLYGRVLIPQAVLSELQHQGTPSARLPEWRIENHVLPFRGAKHAEDPQLD